MIYYDPGAGPATQAFHFRHTVLPFVLSHPGFWLCLVGHICVVCAHRFGHMQNHGILSITWKDTKVLLTLSSICQAFYTNEVFSRYKHIHSSTCKLLKHVLQVCYNLRVHLRGSGLQQHARLAARYCICSVIIVFYQMNENDAEIQWHELLRTGLVTQEEMSYLVSFHVSERRTILLAWCADVFQAGQQKLSLNPNVLNEFIRILSEIRQFGQDVLDTLILKIPFQYFHLLNWMVLTNLVVLAYFMGVGGHITHTFIYVAVELILLGLLRFTAVLLVPFGLSEGDFDAQEWLAGFIKDVALLLETDNPLSQNAFEKALEREQLLPPEAASIPMHTEDEAMHMRTSFGTRATYTPLLPVDYSSDDDWFV